MSARSELLLADAISVAVYRILNVKIDQIQAAALAKGGSVESALTALEKRLPVRRAAPGLPLTPAVQTRLAISEVAVEMSNLSPGAKKSTIASLISAEVAAETHAQRLRAQTKRLETLLQELEQSEPTRREFYREVARQYAQQKSQLRLGIADNGVFESAVNRLDNLYSETLRL